MKHGIVWLIVGIFLIVYGSSCAAWVDEQFPKNSIVYYYDYEDVLTVVSTGKMDTYPYNVLNQVSFEEKITNEESLVPVAYIKETYDTKIRFYNKANYTLYATSTDGQYIVGSSNHKGYKTISLGEGYSNTVLTLFGQYR